MWLQADFGIFDDFAELDGVVDEDDEVVICEHLHELWQLDTPEKIKINHKIFLPDLILTRFNPISHTCKVKQC